VKLKNKTIRRYINKTCDFFQFSWIVFPPFPIDNRILFFKRDKIDFGFLSNFYPCILYIDGKKWPHAEAYYQAQKSDNPEYHKQILKKLYPSWSKYIGDSRIDNPRISKKSWFRKHPEDLRDDWDSIKLDVMKKALQAKFSQHENLHLSLKKTFPAELIEDSPRDSFWGYGEDGNGFNHLGKLLIEIREKNE